MKWLEHLFILKPATKEIEKKKVRPPSKEPYLLSISDIFFSFKEATDLLHRALLELLDSLKKPPKPLVVFSVSLILVGASSGGIFAFKAQIEPSQTLIKLNPDPGSLASGSEVALASNLAEQAAQSRTGLSLSLSPWLLWCSYRLLLYLLKELSFWTNYWPCWFHTLMYFVIMSLPDGHPHQVAFLNACSMLLDMSPSLPTWNGSVQVTAFLSVVSPTSFVRRRLCSGFGCAMYWQCLLPSYGKSEDLAFASGKPSFWSSREQTSLQQFAGRVCLTMIQCMYVCTCAYTYIVRLCAMLAETLAFTMYLCSRHAAECRPFAGPGLHAKRHYICIWGRLSRTMWFVLKLDVDIVGAGLFTCFNALTTRCPAWCAAGGYRNILGQPAPSWCCCQGAGGFSKLRYKQAVAFRRL